MDARTDVEANASGFFTETYVWEELAAAAPGASAGASGERRR
jgi:hypothetical protein